MRNLIGWLGIAVSIAALTASAAGFLALSRMPPEQRALVPRRSLKTPYLLLMWIALLAGSVGLLLEAGYAGPLLRGWAVLLAAWTLWYAFATLYTVSGMEDVAPGAFRSAATGSAIVAAVVAGVITLLLVGLSRIPA